MARNPQKASPQETGSLLKFPLGIPAFEQETSFRLLARRETAPVVVLESARDGGPCFLAVPVQHIVPDYELALSAEDVSALGFCADCAPAAGDIMMFAILTLSGESVTANLLAPVVINIEASRAVQAVRSDSRYSARAPVRLPGQKASQC